MLAAPAPKATGFACGERASIPPDAVERLEDAVGALLKSIWALGLFDETATLRRAVEATSLYQMLNALGDACLASDTQKNWGSWLRANDLWALLTALKQICDSARAGRPPRPEQELLEYWILSLDIRWAFDGGLHDMVLVVLRLHLHPKAYESRELHDAKESMSALVLQLPFSTVLEER